MSTKTIDVVCPACRSGFVLPEDSAGGAFVCPACSHTLEVDIQQDRPASSEPAGTGVATAVAPKPVGTTAAIPVAAPASVRAASASPGPKPAPPAAAAASEPRTEIVCPRCQLHFSPERHTVEVRPGDRYRILLVEAEGYSRDATVEALSVDYDVITAGTVDAAARLLALGGIDLMVLDVDIDQGFGRQLLRGGPLKTCPIVLYGHDESEFYGEAWEAARQQGADDMVIKGMNAAESLVRKVGALLGRPTDDED